MSLRSSKVSVKTKWLLGSIISITMAIISLIWPLFNLALEERLRMRPGLLPYDWWYEPPNGTLLKLHFFNITNSERFLKGLDPKINVSEVGPIVYRTVVTHSDVVFNANGTMSYTLLYDYVYEKSLNNVDLNTTINVPNVAVMMTLSTYWNYNYFLKKIINYAFAKTKSKPIEKKTIYEMLYNNTNKLLQLAHAIAPNVAVSGNAAMFPLFSNGFRTRVTVYVGNKFGHQKFFLVDKLNGSIYLPTNDETCKEIVANSSTGVLFQQLMEKSKSIRYYHTQTCGIYEYIYQGEVDKRGLKAYRYVLAKDLYNRKLPLENDCYKGHPVLPNGLSDLSLCWYSFPIARSNPHFLYGDPKLLSHVNGMKPNASKHTTYCVVEPITGTLMESKGYFQVNIYVRPWKDFDEAFEKFNDIILPVFYAEMTTFLPSHVAAILRIVQLLPIIGNIISTLLFILGFYCVWNFTRRLFKKDIEKKTDSMYPNVIETESFIEAVKEDVN